MLLVVMWLTLAVATRHMLLSQEVPALAAESALADDIAAVVSGQSPTASTGEPIVSADVAGEEVSKEEGASKGKLIGVIPGGWRFTEQWSTRHDLDSIKEIDIFEMYLNPRE